MEIVALPLQPALVVPTTVNVVGTSGLTTAEAVVAETPGDHTYVAPPAAFKVVVPAPAHTVVFAHDTVIVGEGAN